MKKGCFFRKNLVYFKTQSRKKITKRKIESKEEKEKANLKA